MEIVIVANGDIKNTNILKTVIEKNDYVICADGAARYLKELNVYPDLLVGDLDSITKDTLEWIENGKVKTKRFPPKKDMTDTELAVEFAFEKSPTEITIVGAIGTRMDHSLGNLMLLYKIHNMNIKARIINEFNDITITNNILNLKGKIGQTISIIPIGGNVKGVTLEGLEYPLIDHSIDMGSSLGISNKFKGERAVISVKEGTILVVKVLNE